MVLRNRYGFASGKVGPAFTAPAPTQLEQQLTASLEMVATEKRFGTRFTVPSVSDYALAEVHFELRKACTP